MDKLVIYINFLNYHKDFKMFKSSLLVFIHKYVTMIGSLIFLIISSTIFFYNLIIDNTILYEFFTIVLLVSYVFFNTIFRIHPAKVKDGKLFLLYFLKWNIIDEYTYKYFSKGLIHLELKNKNYFIKKVYIPVWTKQDSGILNYFLKKHNSSFSIDNTNIEKSKNLNNMILKSSVRAYFYVYSYYIIRIIFTIALCYFIFYEINLNYMYIYKTLAIIALIIVILPISENVLAKIIEGNLYLKFLFKMLVNCGYMCLNLKYIKKYLFQ